MAVRSVRQDVKNAVFPGIYKDTLVLSGVCITFAKCNWIQQGKNLIVTGKSSSGKSYLANALCICSLRRFKTVKYIKANQLINELSKAEKMDNYQEVLNQMASYEYDFGLMNLDINRCRNLFEVFDSRDPHKSILVISQIPVASWYDMFQEHTYAEACLARLLSEAYCLEMKWQEHEKYNAYK